MSKTKKCRVCSESFRPSESTQVVCGVPCAIQFARKSRDKADRKRVSAERKEYRAKKEAMKSRSDWMKEAQIAFNAYIRERDKDKPCICCGQPLVSGDVGGRFDCGHYRSVGSAPHLRFDERNAHAQRKQCNRWGAGRAVDYRIGLIYRIGAEAVAELESDNDQRKHSIEELKAIKALYVAKRKELQL